MPSRVLKPETLERVRLAAHAARELDPGDRTLLDMAYMSASTDDEIPLEVRRRLAADPLAQRYAGTVVARWTA